MKNAHFLSFERKLHFDEMCWRNEFSDEVKKHFILVYSVVLFTFVFISQWVKNFLSMALNNNNKKIIS